MVDLFSSNWYFKFFLVVKCFIYLPMCVLLDEMTRVVSLNCSCRCNSGCCYCDCGYDCGHCSCFKASCDCYGVKNYNVFLKVYIKLHHYVVALFTHYSRVLVCFVHIFIERCLKYTLEICQCILCRLGFRFINVIFLWEQWNEYGWNHMMLFWCGHTHDWKPHQLRCDTLADVTATAILRLQLQMRTTI
jgi:hypothetical protein